MLNKNTHQKQHNVTEFDGLVQERRNSSALAMELCLSCTNPPTLGCQFKQCTQPYLQTKADTD